MPEQELDLFELAPSLAAQLGAGAAEVVESELAELRLFGITQDQPPDRLFAPDLGTGKRTSLPLRPENPAFSGSGGLQASAARPMTASYGRDCS